MRLAIQLYTLRTIDALAALPTLARQGYEAVELYATPDDATDLRRRLDDAALEVCGWHVAIERLEGALDEVGEQARVLGVPRLVVPWAERPADRAGAEALAERLAALHERVAAAGFPLGYHNHGHELEPLSDGTVVLDVLARSTASSSSSTSAGCGSPARIRRRGLRSMPAASRSSTQRTSPTARRACRSARGRSATTGSSTPPATRVSNG